MAGEKTGALLTNGLNGQSAVQLMASAPIKLLDCRGLH
jgi:hypothetical protein